MNRVVKHKESETVEFKRSVAELNEAVRSISAILNKHQKGELIKVCFEGNQIPYSAEGKYFIRVADEDKQLSAAELKKLVLSNSKYHWD